MEREKAKIRLQLREYNQWRKNFLLALENFRVAALILKFLLAANFSCVRSPRKTDAVTLLYYTSQCLALSFGMIAVDNLA